MQEVDREKFELCLRDLKNSNEGEYKLQSTFPLGFTAIIFRRIGQQLIRKIIAKYLGDVTVSFTRTGALSNPVYIVTIC